jgi:large subunit ribosomal protein L32
MAVPKRRTSKRRRDQRRAHDALSVPVVGKCPNCGEALRPHRVCPSCGYYKGQAVTQKVAD